jgi:oligopeptide/dipeptide ABC transporter ATP-binding protein
MSENNDDIIVVENLRKYFQSEKTMLDNFMRREPEYIKAVDGVDFSIRRGETFSLVGETGSGKTTIGKMILRLLEPSSGKIYFDGANLVEFNDEEIKHFRKEARMIFQDPFASLNPRMTVGKIIQLPIDIHGQYPIEEKENIVLKTMEQVGLQPASELITRLPHELSGGQRQRVGVARAIVLNPKFVVADEPVSSLDVSIRAQVLNLLTELKDAFNLTYCLIAHDLTIVRHMSDRVLVMYLGKPMEMASVERLFKSAVHPYTKALISAVPEADPNIRVERIKLEGEMPSAVDPPKGCRFHTRCPFSTNECEDIEPSFIEISKDHFVACSQELE